MNSLDSLYNKIMVSPSNFFDHIIFDDFYSGYRYKLHDHSFLVDLGDISIPDICLTRLKRHKLRLF